MKNKRKDYIFICLSIIYDSKKRREKKGWKKNNFHLYSFVEGQLGGAFVYMVLYYEL